MKTTLMPLSVCILCATSAFSGALRPAAQPLNAAEYFVATNGCDAADGSAGRPWRTIQRAASIAGPGDTITIRGGVYREWVKPANAGTEGAPVVYRAAPGEKVVVTGADPVRGWKKRADGLWEAHVAYDTFGGLNPFTDFIAGRWFEPRGKKHFRTRLLQDGKPLKLLGEEVFAGAKGVPKLAPGSAALVPGRGAWGTIIAAFKRAPKVSVPELVVRPACFYPLEPRRDYITLKGITFTNAGPDWAHPRGEQVGVVGTHWSRGWTIEDCTISGSSCAGLTLGKCANDFDAFWLDRKQLFSLWALRLHKRDWSETGHHAVRRCRIDDCGQAGICGAFGCAFSTIEDCEISRCFWKKPFGGAEMGGIKLHAAIDVTIARCRIHHCGGPSACAGIWFDWMGQGSRITGNTMWANAFDLFFEVNHGPILVEGNDLLSGKVLRSCSQGVAFVANRMRGGCNYWNDKRRTPVMKPHSTEPDSLDKYASGQGGYVFVNNIFGSNLHFKDEKHPSRFEDNWTIPAKFWKIDDATGECTISPPAGSVAPHFGPVDAKRLGKPVFVDQEYPVPSVTQPKKPVPSKEEAETNNNRG